MGVVYVFNASPQAVRLSINNPQRPGSQIAATSSGTKCPYNQKATCPYTPFGGQVARSDIPSTSGAFINGQPNSVTVQTQNGQSRPVSLAVPADPDGTADLWLYVFTSVMILFDTRGRQVDQEPVYWGSVNADASETRVSKSPPTRAGGERGGGAAGRRGRAAKGGRR